MLTKKEKEVFDFIENYIGANDIAPTLPEIAQGIGFSSKGTTSRYVSALVDAGYLLRKKSKGLSRNLFLPEEPEVTIGRINTSIPLIGTIAAGEPIEALEAPDRRDINDIIYGHNLYMLQVKGQSMIEEGIFDGDFIICERVNSARDGDIVVALVEREEATLKKIYLRGDKVLLCPANTEMAPMEFKAADVQIQGKLKYKLRTY